MHQCEQQMVENDRCETESDTNRVRKEDWQLRTNTRGLENGCMKCVQGTSDGTTTDGKFETMPGMGTQMS